MVKTDGPLLVRIDGDDLTTYDVTGADPARLGSLDLPGSTRRGDAAELLLVGDRAVVLSTDRRTLDDQRTTPDPGARTVDLADPAAPAVVARADLRRRASLVRAAVRRHRAARARLRAARPRLRAADGWRSESEAARANRAIVRAQHHRGLAAHGPRRRRRARAARRLRRDVSRPARRRRRWARLVVVGFDAADPTERSTASAWPPHRALVYFSTDRLYLATSAGWWRCALLHGDWPLRRCRRRFRRRRRDAATCTPSRSTATRRDVPRLRRGRGRRSPTAGRWTRPTACCGSRSAPTGETGNFNSVVTLREDGDDLVEIGRVDRLGVDEQIKSVRWFDDLAIVVTFRQVDPLYAIDLADPDAPRLLGELKIPGFTEYLHPIGDDRLIGIGKDADRDGMTRGGAGRASSTSPT